jgi:cytochrome P450
LQNGYAEELDLFTSQLAEARRRIERGEDLSQSFAQYVIERQQELKLSDIEASYLIGGMFGAGSDTSASAVSISVLAAARYPEAQKRVWEELDRVIGNERLPTLMDQDQLPQTMAWVLETFRWRPVTAGGLAHKSTKDIVWVRASYLSLLPES